jgi:integrase
LAQLHLADVREDVETGVHLIDITEEVDEQNGAKAAKSLKRDSSTRSCPLHRALIDAGLLQYVEALRVAGYDRLFPELVPDSIGKVGPRASEWFTDYRRSKGVGEVVGKSRKVFHSFRHSMNAALQKAGVSQEIREALCGHSSKSINVRVYGDVPLIRALNDAIDRLDYGIQHVRYCSGDSHEIGRNRAVARNQRRSRIP